MFLGKMTLEASQFRVAGFACRLGAKIDVVTKDSLFRVIRGSPAALVAPLRQSFLDDGLLLSVDTIDCVSEPGRIVGSGTRETFRELLNIGRCPGEVSGIIFDPRQRVGGNIPPTKTVTHDLALVFGAHRTICVRCHIKFLCASIFLEEIRRGVKADKATFVALYLDGSRAQL